MQGGVIPKFTFNIIPILIIILPQILFTLYTRSFIASILLLVLIQAALSKSADKPKLMEALKDLCTLLIEVSSINLFSWVKTLGSSRRPLRRNIFGAHYSSVSAKLIEGSLISGQLFAKADSEKANTNMGLQTINVGTIREKIQLSLLDFGNFNNQNETSQIVPPKFLLQTRTSSSSFRGTSSGYRRKRSRGEKFRGGLRANKGSSSVNGSGLTPKSQ